MGTLRQDRGYGISQLRRNRGLAAVAVFFWGAALCAGAGDQDVIAAPEPGKSRPFRMGFTAFPHDFTLEAVEQTRQFVRDNADLIAHHIEGVPWAEALRNAPFPSEVQSDHESKRSMKPPGGEGVSRHLARAR